MTRHLVLANEATAARRRVYFHLVDATDAFTPETGEASGQPQISTNGAAWTNTGIGTLTAIGSGRYYADLTQAAVLTAGDVIETRFKSANTAECPGDSVHVVAFDPHAATNLGLSALPAAAADAAGGLPISDAGGLDLDAMNTAAVRLTAARAQVLDDWIDAGRLDALLDAIKAVTDNLPESGALTTIAADAARLTAARAQVLTDWIDAGRLDALLDAVKAVTDNLPDSGALTTIAADAARLTAARAQVLDDWVNTGRLDTLLDAVKAKTDNLPSDPADQSLIIAATDALVTLIGAPVADLATDIAAVKAVADAIKVITDAVPDSGAMSSIAQASAVATIDTVVDAIRVVTDALGPVAAARLAASSGQMIPFTVDTATNTHTPTTSEFQADDVTEATADHFNGRNVLWTSGALTGQMTDITDYAAVGGIGQFTVTPLTEPPANNDTGIII